MSTRRLVFGDDGSTAADVAWLWINSHSWPGWTISVVEAHQPEEFAIVPPDRTTLHPWEPQHPRELIAPAADTVLEHLAAEADPRVVLDSAGDADLMVIGPRGRGALKQLHIGSTAEWLLVRPNPPLTIIRAARTTHRVLVCVDGSHHARLATQTVAALPWIDTCTVTVLAVKDGITEAESAIDEAVATLRAAGAETHALRTDANHGGAAAPRDARTVILGVIASLDVDLVALGTRGIGTFRRAFIGSTASAVALHAPCNVLVVYETAGEDSDGLAQAES